MSILTMLRSPSLTTAGAGLAAAALALVFASPACDPAIPEQWEVTGAPSCRDQAHATEAYYTETMAPFFDEYCLYCHSSENEGTDRHGAPDARNFDTFEAAKVAPSTVWTRVSAFEMPPVGRLPSEEELDTLLDWLNCVSPRPAAPEELGDCAEGGSATDSQVNGFLTRNCTRCHSSVLTGAEDRQNAPEGVNWDTVADLRAFGSSDYIWGRVHAGEMPADTGTVAPEDALLFWDWLSCN